jgi:hypothetical protein
VPPPRAVRRCGRRGAPCCEACAPDLPSHPPRLPPAARLPLLPLQVTLHLSKEVPLMVEYKLESLGYLRYFLAPKIDEDAA